MPCFSGRTAEAFLNLLEGAMVNGVPAGDEETKVLWARDGSFFGSYLTLRSSALLYFCDCCYTMARLVPAQTGGGMCSSCTEWSPRGRFVMDGFI